MEAQKKLSVIVCVYNTEEKLLDECLASVFLSTLQSVEVIVVNDGSDSDYLSLQKKYNKAKFFKTENAGTLSARLFGIEKAMGEFIAFVDSDDLVTFDYFEALVTRAEAGEADICLGDWAFLTESTAYKCANDYTIKNLFMADGDLVLRMYFYPQGKEHSWYVLWNKIFKSDILKDVAREIKLLNFPKQTYAEDVLITFFAFTKAKKINNIHLGTYFYRIHLSQQIVINSEEKLLSHISQMVRVFDAMERELKILGRFEEVKFNFFGWKKLMSSSHYMVAKNSKYKNLYGEIKEAYKVKKLHKIPKNAEKVYAKHMLFPKNYAEVDTSLKKVYYSNKFLKIYAKKDSFAYNEIIQMKKFLGKRIELVKRKKYATFVFPKQKYSLKQKLLHNYFVYSVGIFLFPKGSRIRKKLKSKI